MRLDQIGVDGQVQLDASALSAIAAALRERLEGQFGSRFFAAVDPEDIGPVTGEDLRGRDRSLNFIVEYTGPTYRIEGFELHYLYEGYEGQPAIEELMNVGVDLVPTEDVGFVAWRPGVAPMRLTLNEIAARPAEA